VAKPKPKPLSLGKALTGSLISKIRKTSVGQNINKMLTRQGTITTIFTKKNKKSDALSVPVVKEQPYVPPQIKLEDKKSKIKDPLQMKIEAFRLKKEIEEKFLNLEQVEKAKFKEKMMEKKSGNGDFILK
jgi:hypothetical protein